MTAPAVPSSPACRERRERIREILGSLNVSALPAGEQALTYRVLHKAGFADHEIADTLGATVAYVSWLRTRHRTW